TVAHILNELRKVVVGQDDVVEQILVAILAEGHALIEGVPGTAKTLIVKTIAAIINARFSRIQFTPDLMPSDITGTNVFNMQT
ncbi:AAA family ATPase, partial [Escherichia coli]|nr:AAA family ATPase [Escherichia coli]